MEIYGNNGPNWCGDIMDYVELKEISNSDVDTFVEDCDLFAVFDAPVNVLFPNVFLNNIYKYKDIFVANNMHNNIFFSCKSNKGNCFLKKATDLGCGIEVSSIYELNDALKYTTKIIASGPAKSIKYIDKAIKNNTIISVDDMEELNLIYSRGRPVKVLLRINNLLDNVISRFGININQIEQCLKIIKNSFISLEGFSFHINNYNLDDRILAIKKIIKLKKLYKTNIRFIDIGGGFPTNYCSKESYGLFLKNNNSDFYFNGKNFKDFYPYYNEIADDKSLEYILKKVRKILGNTEIIIEPGRSLVRNCGISIFEVEYVKTLSNGEKIIVTNGNINDLSEQWFNTDYLPEPKLYKKNKEAKKLTKSIYASIAGNLCLEQDMITWRKIKFDYMPEKNDLLIYYNTAGYQMDSNESCFHKIPLVKKFVVRKIADRYVIEEDKKYDCK
jgi:diaminopimelate decarboxylase